MLMDAVTRKPLLKDDWMYPRMDALMQKDSRLTGD
jgi:hypothetical protein